MKTLRTLSLAALVVTGALASATPAQALEPSKYGPWFVQGTIPLGLNVYVGSGGAHAGWLPSVDFGYHFFGTQDGPSLGLRQAFLVTGYPGAAAGETAVRFGWDIALPVGDFELDIEPFVRFGAVYFFDGPHAGISSGVGVDGKFFFLQDLGLYAFFRPLDMGFGCVHDSGNCAFSYQLAGGIGFAF